MNAHVKNILLWVFLFIVAVMLWQMFKGPAQRSDELTYTAFLEAVDRGDVSEVTLSGSDSGYQIEGKYKEKDTRGQEKTFTSYAPNDDNLVESLRAQDVVITATEPKDSPYLFTLLGWAPMLLLIGIWVFFMRQMQAGGNRALSFGRSKAKLSSSQGKKVTFGDVAGVDEAKEELQEIIEFLKDPQKFQKLGGKIPKGVLLMGAPGTGKTLLARAISGEANVPFFSISGSDFVEMFVGVGASRVRDLFEQGKKNAPCIVFIDEIDAVGRHRGAGLGGGHDEREQTLNQLLVEMDGFETNEGVILLAATNRPDVLDPALLRPGRFDRRVVVGLPDLRGREAILKVHTRKIPVAEDVELLVLARGTPGFSGADLASLVNEAALSAARYGKKVVEMADFEYSKDKVLMGSERKSLIISDEEKRNTAYHEAGHTLVALLHPDTDPIHKVTIIPRGLALGLTQQLPVDERHTHTKSYLVGQLAVLMGGRAAEEIFLDQFSTGAGNDIEKATELARKMVCEWGMSERLGPLCFGKKKEQIFLGREIAQHSDYSEATAMEIDKEVRKLGDEAYNEARRLVSENRDTLVRIAEALLEREVLDGSEVEILVQGGTLPTREPETPPPSDTQSPEPGDEKPAEPSLGDSAPLGGPLKQPS
ncbi:MAG: ATP-dependent metallopeptidase FtsH/Yme1/Tma family protein [Acidobacteria bacterium]|nr:MAG: ATP-dependent metallopeptidase FtsH/Yme1/Tma family protein [Acidobacteriota bacterium]